MKTTHCLASLITLVTASLVLQPNWVQADEKIYSESSGTGIYLPATGMFFGPGTESTFGPFTYRGFTETEPTGPLTSTFQNPGRGTKEEQFQRAVYEDGSTLSLRYSGTVELAVENQAEGTFTAVWTGVWEIAEGTGKFKGAKGSFDVTAINKPFKLSDPYWEFDWFWTGNMKIKKNALKKYTVLKTGGFGVFSPANLGVGDPNVLPFPIIIGDGSGIPVYDGTPTGFEFRLDGELVGDGFDQHFGSGLSLTPGLPTGSVIHYPGEEEADPNGINGQKKHIMATRDGEIWFQKIYYFELDPVAGTLVAHCDFNCVGGTERFEDATGTVYCRVLIQLVDVFVDGDGQVNAPFRYDFDGYLELRQQKKMLKAPF